MEDYIKVLTEAEDVIKKLKNIIKNLVEENEQLREQLGLDVGNDVMNISIDELDFSVRTSNCIAFLKNVKGILEYKDWESIKGFGERSALEVCSKLKKLGLEDKMPNTLADKAKLWKYSWF